MRVLLRELRLRRRYQTEVMLRVLEITLGRNRITGSLSIARKLNVFFSNMVRRAADFHIWAVRFIDSGQWVLIAVPITTTHPLLLSVSHRVESLSVKQRT